MEKQEKTTVHVVCDKKIPGLEATEEKTRKDSQARN